MEDKFIQFETFVTKWSIKKTPGVCDVSVVTLVPHEKTKINII